MKASELRAGTLHGALTSNSLGWLSHTPHPATHSSEQKQNKQRQNAQTSMADDDVHFLN